MANGKPRTPAEMQALAEAVQAALRENGRMKIREIMAAVKYSWAKRTMYDDLKLFEKQGLVEQKGRLFWQLPNQDLSNTRWGAKGWKSAGEAQAEAPEQAEAPQKQAEALHTPAFFEDLATVQDVTIRVRIIVSVEMEKE